ncbi:hypothetical protein GCM10023321_55990 [Pseudonocardia eucalypti]|uniref:Uncharacterized protein n=1 Tax=Pseudonocardia eucalypti TaxID=648755 RepID=A0ABP9QQI2_9PSEU
MPNKCDPARFARTRASSAPSRRASGSCATSPMNLATIEAALGDTDTEPTIARSRPEISGSSHIAR